MTQAICDITTDEVNVDVVVEPQADTMVEVANRAGGMEQVFHDNTLIGNGNSVDLGVNTDIIATKEYVDEKVESIDTYTKDQIDGKLTAVDAQIDANADAIQKTREDYIQADSEIHQILNNHAENLTTLHNDVDDLGDQVAEIESKIPESASDTNPLVTKEDLKSIDLEGYATTEYVNAREQEIRDDVNQADSELQSQITAQASAITANTTSINGVKAVIPDGTSDTNPLINKQQLLEEEMDIREDLNSGLSELQTQITTQAAEIATKQDQLIAGENITIVDNVISATGGGGGVSGDYLPLSGGTLTGTLLLAKTGRYALESMGEMKITNSETGAFTYLNGGNIQVGPAKIIGEGTSTSNPTLQIGLGTINSYYQFTTTGFFATRTESKILGSKTSPWEVVYAKTISVGGSGYDITVPQKTGTIALAEDIEQAVNTQNLTVGSGEGSLYMGVVAGTATIATNNGLDIAAQTKFDTAPTTDDNTTYANALEVSLMRKAQVAAAISDAMANVDALPDQTSNAGKVLTTDGSEASWTDMPGLIIRRL